MKIRTGATIASLIVLVCAAAQSLATKATPGDDTADLAAEFARLDGTDETGGSAWYSLAVRAREAGDAATAERALERAAEREYSPVRIHLERARAAVAAGDPASAIAGLQALADGGFTAVALITDDSLLSSLAGHQEYDSLVENLSRQAYPCEYQEKFRKFDFWVGEWEVHDAAGTPAGRNVIEATHRGCVLVEHWTSASGGSGMSINYLDGATGEWVQSWVDSGGGQIMIRGGMTDQGMRLSGQIHDIASGTTAPFRGLWTLLPDGRVRQYFEQSNDGGETWVSWFEGFYSRLDGNPKATMDKTRTK